jgi:4-hydroxy-tetrahydrodipicolinate synthase
VFPALVTPLTADANDIDEDALTRLSRKLAAAGVGGLVPCGSTGEFATLSHAERRRVTELVLQAVGDLTRVIPHTGALTTEETVELSRHAETLGAAGVMIVAPFYERPDMDELVEHLLAVRRSISIPIVYYNIPSVTGIKLSPSELVALTKRCGIAYVKDTTGDAVALTELVERYSEDVTTFNGWDSMTLLGLAAGTHGAIWGAANFIPELCVELFDSVHERSDLAHARQLWRRIWPICQFLETHTYVPAVKAGCELVGDPVGPPRPPFRPLPESERAKLGLLLDQAGVMFAAAR